MPKPRPLAGRTIVVANATCPIGAAIARAAAAAGARLLLIDTGEAALGETVRAINNAGGISDYAVAAAGNAAALAAAGRVAVQRFGRIDAWIDPAAGDADAIATTRAATVPLLGRGGGVLVLVAPAAAPAEAIRASLATDAPSVTLAIVVAPAAADPARVAAAALRMAERPKRVVEISSPRRAPALAAAVAIGSLALAAVGFAALRRRRRV